jgi:dihydroorotate dehydrogenase electron transfer subunit
MTKTICEKTLVVKKRNLKNDYYSLTFGPYSGSTGCRPGHFFHLRLPSADIFFRRAMSVAGVDTEQQEAEIIFRAIGRGTTLLSRMTKGDELDVLGPLGKPFSLPKRGEIPVIVAGGVGLPPMLYLAEDLVRRGTSPDRIEFFYGGRSSSDIIERSRIKKTGVRFHPTTDDGSFGQKGLVTEFVEKLFMAEPKGKYRLYACGPEPMLKAVDQIGVRMKVPGQLSLEAPMPCGYGVCLGCVVPLTSGGNARVCADGPVFDIGEVKL